MPQGGRCVPLGLISSSACASPHADLHEFTSPFSSDACGGCGTSPRARLIPSSRISIPGPIWAPVMGAALAPPRCTWLDSLTPPGAAPPCTPHSLCATAWCTSPSACAVGGTSPRAWLITSSRTPTCQCRNHASRRSPAVADHWPALSFDAVTASAGPTAPLLTQSLSRTSPRACAGGGRLVLGSSTPSRDRPWPETFCPAGDCPALHTAFPR